MEGLSSDVYLYNTQDQQIWRLTAGPKEVQFISWSPDGRWILSASTDAYGPGARYEFYAVTLHGQAVRDLPLTTSAEVTWLDGHRFFVHDDGVVTGGHNLRLVDLESGTVIEIWEGGYASWAVSRDRNWVCLWAATPTYPYPQPDPNFSPGFQLVNLATSHSKRVELPGVEVTDLRIVPFGEAGADFVLHLGELYMLSSDGTLTASGYGDGRIDVSPDGAYWLVADDLSVSVYSAEAGLLRVVRNPIGETEMEMAWFPGQPDLFISTFSDNQDRLYAFNLYEGELTLVESYLDSWFGFLVVKRP